MPSHFHEALITLAVAQQAASRAKFKGQPPDILVDALFLLAHDSITVLRALAALLDAGWPGPSASLLRTLLDMLLSSVIITHGNDPPTLAFKYIYSGFRRHGRDQTLPPEVRRGLRDQMRQRLHQLPESQRPGAFAMLRDKDRPYWFSPLFKSPMEAAEFHGSKELAWTYAQLSGAAHGTFMGLRLYRENPDAQSIQPEPKGTRSVSVDLSACRFVIALLLNKEAYEDTGLLPQLKAYEAALLSYANSSRPLPAT